MAEKRINADYLNRHKSDEALLTMWQKDATEKNKIEMQLQNL